MRIRIGIAIIISFLLSSFISNALFIAQTPTVRPDLDKYFAGKINSLAGTIISIIPFNGQVKTAAGIYAKSDSTHSYTIVKEGEVLWQEYTFEINGKIVKVKVPKGELPPSQEMLTKVNF